MKGLGIFYLKLFHGHSPKPVASHSVHVLLNADPVEAVPLVDLRREWMLEEDALHAGIPVQLVDCTKHFFRRGVLWEENLPRFHPHALAGVSFPSHRSALSADDQLRYQHLATDGQPCSYLLGRLFPQRQCSMLTAFALVLLLISNARNSR
jgi:hypothetical protein